MLYEDIENLDKLKDKKFLISSQFKKYLLNKVYVKHFEDVIEYALLNYRNTRTSNTLIYQKHDSEGKEFYYNQVDVIDQKGTTIKK